MASGKPFSRVRVWLMPLACICLASQLGAQFPVAVDPTWTEQQELTAADGAMGDMGGGSVELVRLKKGVVGPGVTMPCGPMRLMALGSSRSDIVPIIDTRLSALPWLPEISGRTFYAVGGVWRALAKVHMEQHGWPLHIIHHYAIDAQEAIEFAQLLSRQSRISLEGSSISRRRLDALPYAAMFIERLLKKGRPNRLVFSAFGLREGILYDLLDPAQRAEDPLMAACAAVAGLVGRFDRWPARYRYRS